MASRCVSAISDLNPEIAKKPAVETDYKKTTLNIYNMASRCVSAISDLNPEIAARGEAEGCYLGVQV